ncbi:hypothetical protein M0R45_034924 [Rubus argutus]|uniref:Uncharacterized protein n=1 Tax=Rubus argutus TaxID=59490 RepID=A0AAW1VU29_RUBAR
MAVDAAKPRPRRPEPKLSSSRHHHRGVASSPSHLKPVIHQLRRRHRPLPSPLQSSPCSIRSPSCTPAPTPTSPCSPHLVRRHLCKTRDLRLSHRPQSISLGAN